MAERVGERDAGHRSVGILTFHRCINYGSYWQARCLAEGLRQAGAEARILDHASRSVEIREWRCALRPAIDAASHPGEAKAYAGKVRAFARARRSLPLGPEFQLDHPETAGLFDMVVIGSDEVWNFRHPWYAGCRPFFGAGLQADHIVAYAASFGNHDAADGISPDYREELRRFRRISVRDANSRDLVREALGATPITVLDPCLQFADCIKVEDAGSEPQLVLYGHDFPPWLLEQVRAFAQANGLRVVSIGYHCDGADEQRLSAGPEEFSRTMAGAAAIVTNFFHGCIFALAFRRPFATTPSPYRFNKIRDLTGLLGAADHIVGPETAAATYETLLSEPASEQVYRRIEGLRKESGDFLRDALALV